MRSPLLPIFLTVFVDVLGLTLILPLLPYYAKDYGASDFQATLLTSVYAAAMFVSGPMLGRLSDRIGRKPVLLLSQAGTLIGWLTLAAAHSLEMLFVGRIIAGLTAGNLSIAQAYISDVTKPNEERTQAFGFFGIAFGTGFLLGPGITALLTYVFRDDPDPLFKYKPPTLAAAGLSLLAILLTAFFLPARKPTAQTGRRLSGMAEYLARPGPRKHLAEFFFFSLSFAALTGALGVYLKKQFDYELHEAGLIFGLSGLIGAMVQGGMLKRLVKRLGEERLTAIGLGTMVLGYCLLGLATNVGFLLVLVVLGSFGAAVVRPSVTTLITKSVPKEEQGTVLGVSQSLGSLAQIAGPAAAGWLIDRDQVVMYGLFCAAFSLLGLLLALQRRGVERPVEQAPAEG
ncbi:MFS transporter [Polyangium sp. 15x6]|uniref:MFS transporter n=1 Tax=Polyangium sp. 15x6 TaxID=3042687 RepID=UPI00249CB088|nr:MFS transporter [Polyangium sp. 15x6]MDI3290847.1 MFS transporter [Polyangium sp. 15x6]